MAQRFYKFRGESLDEAYREMRKKLGPQALVVRTAQVHEGGFLGFFGKTSIEVTASAPVAPAARPRTRAERNYADTAKLGRVTPPASGPVGSNTNVNETVAFFKEVVDKAQAPNRPAQLDPASITPLPSEPVAKPKPFSAKVLQFRKPDKAAAAEGPAIHGELREMRSMLEVLMAERPDTTGVPTEFAPHYQHLVKCGVARNVAASLMAAVARGADLSVLRDERGFTERLKLQMRRRISTSGGVHLTPGTRRTVAFVGATGVGKTTNLAKLAAHFAVQEKARVALITADTYRVGAPEQLRVYANIIGLPMKVVNDPDEMKEALRAVHDYDLVLVDTAGGSQYNREQLKDLKRMMVAAEPDEVHLVISANTQLDDARQVVSNFQCVGPTALLFTKLDETQRYGMMFSLVSACELPLSYLSVGQNVPDDLMLAKTGMVANLMIQGGAKRERSSA